jgi:branched-chain amino acid transport system permease protein
LSGLAGMLISPLSSANTGMGISLAIKGFAAAILGGAGSIFGAIAGGFFLGLIEALAGRYIASGYNAAIPFLLMIVVLFIRPTGLLGHKEIEKV